MSATTGDVDLAYGIKIRLTCSFPVYLTPPSEIEPGESSTCYVQVNPGTVSLEVYIPSPVDDWFSVSEEIYTLASAFYITIVPGLSATLRISPSASLTVDGPGSIDITSTTFENVGSGETFLVSCYGDASHGAQITVNADFGLDIDIGLSIDLFMFRQEVASTPIGSFSMKPRVSDTVVVSTFLGRIFDAVFSPWGIFMLLLVALFVFGTVAMVVSSRRKRKEQARKVIPKPLEKPKVMKKKPLPKIETVYCIYCGEELPSQAVYCRKCGKRVE